MATYDNQGAIWKNDYKYDEYGKLKQGANRNGPDLTGTATINGIEYRIAAWKRKPDADAKSPAVTLKFELVDKTKRNPKQQTVDDGEPFNDSIPF